MNKITNKEKRIKDTAGHIYRHSTPLVAVPDRHELRKGSTMELPLSHLEQKDRVTAEVARSVDDRSDSPVNNFLNDLAQILPMDEGVNAKVLEVYGLNLRRLGLGQSTNYTPEQLIAVFAMYVNFRLNEDTHTVKEMIRAGTHAGTWSTTEMQKPLTLESFYTFAGITRKAFTAYLDSEDPAMCAVAEYIHGAIRSNLIDSGLSSTAPARLVELLTGLQSTQNINVNNTTKQITLQIDGQPIDLAKKQRISQNDIKDANFSEVE